MKIKLQQLKRELANAEAKLLEAESDIQDAQQRQNSWMNERLNLLIAIDKLSVTQKKKHRGFKMNFLCMIRHKWEDVPKPYPELAVLAIRGCRRCGRIESLNDGRWFEFAEGWTLSLWINYMVEHYAPELPEYYFRTSVAGEPTK